MCKHENWKLDKHYYFCPDCQENIIMPLEEHHIQHNTEEDNEKVTRALIAAVMNTQGVDSKLNTPGFILAQYLFRSLKIYEQACKALSVCVKQKTTLDIQQTMTSNIAKYVSEKSVENFVSTTSACDAWHKDGFKIDYKTDDETKDIECTHQDYNFKDHGRCCHRCGEVLNDFGD